jgi:nitrite reductase (NO-forming)
MSMRTSSDVPAETAPAGGDGRGPLYRGSVTERAEFRWWTGAVTFAALAALLVSIGAIARHPKATSTTSSAAAAPAGQTINFDASAPAAFTPRDPAAPAPLPGTVHDIVVRIEPIQREIAPGVTQTMWTFGGTVPGPVYRGKVGDTFNFTIVNADEQMTHSIDFHAGMVSPSRFMGPIAPGTSRTYSFRANHAGIFMYHCGTPPVLEHIGMGMYGAVIIDPPDLAPVDHEYVLVQSELYTAKGGGVPDLSTFLDERWSAIVFNGYVDQYKYAPINVATGQRIRVWVLDAGPTDSSSFHVIGTIFDTVYKEGAYLLRPGAGGSQALDLNAAQGGFVEFTPTEAGSYTFVTHRFADASKGAVGVFQVGAPTGAAG